MTRRKCKANTAPPKNPKSQGLYYTFRRHRHDPPGVVGGCSLSQSLRGHHDDLPAGAGSRFYSDTVLMRSQASSRMHAHSKA